jgi:SAM-dependent methyltransferase
VDDSDLDADMDYQGIYYPESRFGGFTDVDGTIAFYTRVEALLRPSSVVLDVGCGRGAYADDPVQVRRERRIFKGKCRKVIGIDVDRLAAGNPYIDEFRQIENGYWPLADDSIDLCVCDCVLEHVEDPVSFFGECRRILKSGGHLCIRTPNVRSYIGLFSMLIPNRYHASVVGRVQSEKRAEDVFPTFYRCNTSGKLREMLEDHGFDHCVYEYESEPYYLSFSRLFYYLGVLHQRFALRCFKAAIFAFANKRPVENL